MRKMMTAFFVTLAIGMCVAKLYELYHPCEAMCSGQRLPVAFKCEHPDMVACMCGNPRRASRIR